MTDQRYGIGILGVGKHLPARLVCNETIESQCGLAPGTIEQKTGIRSRYLADEGDTASGYSVAAARQALDGAGVAAEEIGLIVCCTFTGDYVYPALACKVQQLLGARRAGAFDVMANCTGFQVGLTVASDRMKVDPTIGFALVIGTALQSRFIDWTDAESAMYFGDGAGAALLGHVAEGDGILASEIFSNGAVFDAVRLRGGGSSFPLRPDNIGRGLQFYEMNGLEVWKQVVQYQPKAIRQALAKLGKTTEDVGFFIFHQANLNLIQYLMAKMKQPMTKTYTNVAEIGNTADASMAIALCDAVQRGLLSHGCLVVISGVGAGFTFGATVIKWSCPK
jgi:3-oxoacyl-[acyl-carrier-protein] synthase-3